ncbi:MFS transporter [Acetobacter sp.]|uniref:MFS transporter n=1 Tax=Acetobacter sp. TaxID=440 RepID=UPI0039E79BDF
MVQTSPTAPPDMPAANRGGATQHAPAPDTDVRGQVRYSAVVPLFMAVLLSVLDYAVANIALPTISGALSVTQAESVWVVNAYQLANAMLLLPLAAWADRLGSARLCQAGLVVIMLGSALCATTSSFGMLVFARIIQGAGGACVMSVSAALVRSVYPPALLGRGLALNALVTALGFAISPAVASVILSVASWRWLFLFNLPYGVLTLALALRFFPATPVHANTIKPLPVVLNLLFFGGVLVGADLLAHGNAPLAGWGTLLGGVACLLALLHVQREAQTPLLPVDLLVKWPFGLAFTVCFMGYMAANFFMVSIPFALTGIFGRTAVQSGFIIMFWPAGMVAAGPLVGRLSDRVPAAVLSTCGLVVVGVGYLLLRMTPIDAADWNIMWRLGLAGVGFAFFVAPNNKAMMDAAPLHRSRSASAMLSVARIMGQSTGAIFVALVMAHVHQGAALLCLELGVATAWGAAALSLSRARMTFRPAS